MATSYSTNVGPHIGLATITEAAAADGSKVMTATINNGLTIDEQVRAIEELKDYILTHGAPDGAAAAP